MRLFIAIPMPEPVQARMGILMSGIPGARWTRPGNIHLTLRFLGETPEADARHLDDALARIHAPAFEMAIEGLGTFGRGRHVRALWADVRADKELFHLQDKVERIAQMQGFPPEARKFSAHVTLARFKSPPGNRLAEFLQANGGFSMPAFTVDRFVLYRSHTGNEAPHYEELRVYELNPA